MRISDGEPVTEGDCFRLGRKTLEVVQAAGTKMAEDAPEVRVIRLALLHDLTVKVVVADHDARMNFEGIEVANVLHPGRREGLCCANRRNRDVCCHDVPLSFE